ncbi:MAG: T9SS type A sorting domain-containing protein, partial [Duncaniella sp.]|nr:T9SS type A sorting domain-containing protein [Duncaniella sp.]
GGIANSCGTVLCWLDDVPVSIPDGSTVTAAFSGSLVRFSNGAALEAGDYTISVYNESNRPISDPLSVSISEAPEGDPVFNLSWVVSGYLSGDGSKSNPYITEDQLKIDLTVNVTSGLFAQNVAMYAYYTPSGSNVGFSGETSTVRSYFVGPASSQTQTYTLGLGYFENQKDAYIRPYSTSTRTWLGSPIYVRRIQTGISEITADNAGLHPNPAVSVTTLTAKAPVSAVDIYSLTGVRVMSIGNSGTQSVELDVAGLQPGHYIVVASTSEGIENYRLIKR